MHTYWWRHCCFHQARRSYASDFLQDAYAGSTNTGVSVNASVVAKCIINYTNTASSIDFDEYAAISGNASSVSASLGFRCTRESYAIVSFNNGVNADSVQRRMSDGLGNFLHYALYKDPDYTQPWNEVSTVELNATGTTDVTVMLYAKIPENQDIPAGVYNDTVTLTTSY